MSVMPQQIAAMLKQRQSAQNVVSGIVEPGNINLEGRPQVKNPDGSISTVRSLGVNIEGQEVLIPTVVNGKVVSDKAAIKHYMDTGEHLGKFKTPEDSTNYAIWLHNEEAKKVK
jgi:hypothetical protein